MFARSWFRRRLDTDPRRWVLLLVAIEGFVGFAVNSSARLDLFQSRLAIVIWLVIGATTPAMGVLMMLGHARFLWWTGKLLGGRARPRDIHAVFAWSVLPAVIGAIPLALSVLLRAATVFLKPGPAILREASGVLESSADLLALSLIAGAVVSVVQFVRFLAEAQGFALWRAILNHVLGAVAGLGILAGTILLVQRLFPGPAVQTAGFSSLLVIVLMVAGEGIVIAARRAIAGGEHSGAAPGT